MWMWMWMLLVQPMWVVVAKAHTSRVRQWNCSVGVMALFGLVRRQRQRRKHYQLSALNSIGKGRMYRQRNRNVSERKAER